MLEHHIQMKRKNLMGKFLDSEVNQTIMYVCRQDDDCM